MSFFKEQMLGKESKELNKENKQLNKLPNKDELFEQQYDNDPFEYTKQDMETNEKKGPLIYQTKIKDLEEENNLLSKKHDGLVEAITDLRNQLNDSISPQQMADLRSSWNTEHFKEIAQLKKTIDNMNQDIITQLEMIDLLNSQIEQNNNKSPSEYVELLKNDQTKTELIYTLHDRIFKVKHKGKNKNYNRKYAIETFRCIMEWRNLQKE